MNKEQHYNIILKILSHIILTKPLAVQLVLEAHGVVFTSPPDNDQLIIALGKKLQKGDINFANDIDTLVSSHITYNGEEMLALSKQENTNENGQYDDFWGALIGGVVGIASTVISGSQKKRQQKRQRRAAAAALKQEEQSAISIAKAKAAADIKRMRQESMLLQKQLQKQEEIVREQEAQRVAIAARKAKEKKAKNKKTLQYGFLAILVLGALGWQYKNKGFPFTPSKKPLPLPKPSQ